MPTLGSVSGTYGYGRSPQVLPPPGFTYRTESGTSAPTWSLSNGPFVLSGNVSDPTVGNVYVITPSTTFTCNVKIWGAGGGGANVFTSTSYGDARPGIFRGAAGGAVEATVTFEMGQPYTIFAGGAGVTSPYDAFGETFTNTSGGGGAASGIWLGNIFQLFNSGAKLTTSQVTANVLLAAGGGAGASSSGAGALINSKSILLPGAGGGQVGDDAVAATNLGSVGKSTSGIRANSDWFYGIYHGSLSSKGGSGGTIDANINTPVLTMLGGNSYISDSIEGILSSQSVPGTYGIAGLYDNSYKSFFGDSGEPGRVVLYLDEYRTTSIVATGGDVTTVPIPGHELQYTYHTFTSNGRFTINSTVSTDTVDVFVVGGGGGGADAGGGGGGVVLRTGLQITSGNYLVHVGTGGDTQNRLSSDLGGYWGGYPGNHSAFYNNQLNQYFPDNYHRLIYSFNTVVYFISPDGNDVKNNGSLEFPFATIRGASLRTNNISDLIVYAVLPGTYEPPASAKSSSFTEGYTQIEDGGYPRVWVCSPGKVTITFTNNTNLNNSPYAERCVNLTNPRSAVYGAIFQRNTKVTSTIGNPMFGTSSGLVQNCAFSDDGPWSLFNNDVKNFRIVNCAFYTADNSVRANWQLGSDTASNIVRCLLLNSAFNNTYTVGLTYLPTVDNTTANVKAAMNASNYKITNVTDKGVYAGPYGWGGVITKPESKAVSVTLVAPGGGGGGNAFAYGSKVNNHGGSSGGASSTSADPGVVYQLPWLTNPSYSSYGYPGGRTSVNTIRLDGSTNGAGGGGAAFPGRSNSNQYPAAEGGLGIEWPYGSQTYYGSGGNGDTNYSSPVAHGAGRGGDRGSSGSTGAVVVRYVTPGPYTPPAQFVRTENLVATGGLVTVSNGYKQHVFVTSDVFSICNLPDNAYIDILAVGGGTGGNASKNSSVNFGGFGGLVVYQRLELNSTSIYNYAVTVGAGGQGGSTTTNSGSYSNGAGGSPSSITLPNYTTTLVKISASGGPGYGNALPGSLTTSGLFSDNTNYYGGGGAQGASGSYAGGIGGGGSSPGGSGLTNTGGGGGGGQFGNYQQVPIYSYYGGIIRYEYQGGYSTGGNGGSGLVIIRYPYTP